MEFELPVNLVIKIKNYSILNLFPGDRRIREQQDIQALSEIANVLYKKVYDIFRELSVKEGSLFLRRNT